MISSTLSTICCLVLLLLARQSVGDYLHCYFCIAVNKSLSEPYADVCVDVIDRTPVSWCFPYEKCGLVDVQWESDGNKYVSVMRFCMEPGYCNKMTEGDLNYQGITLPANYTVDDVNCKLCQGELCNGDDDWSILML